MIQCFFLGTLVTMAQSPNTEWSADSNVLNANGVTTQITSNPTIQGDTFT